MLIPMPATREEWLAMRRKYVGASAVAALFHVQADYQDSLYALWHIKAGLAQERDIEGPRLEWGLRLEEAIATGAAEQNGWTVNRGHYAICDDCPGLAASLDFEIVSDPTGEHEGLGVLEVKNADWLQHRRTWTDDEPPIHILLQLQAQLACTGWEWGAVACLVGGNDLRIYRYTAKPKLIADIKRRVAEFWRSVETGRAPQVDGSESAADILKQMYPNVWDEAADMSASNEWPEVVAEFMQAGVAKKEAVERYDLARNRLASLMGDHKRGIGGGFSVNTAITAAKEGRPAREGEMIPGRAESRRYIAKEVAA